MGIWLADGAVQADGPVEQTLAGYRRAIEARAEETADVKGLVRVSKVSVEGMDGQLPRWPRTPSCTSHSRRSSIAPSCSTSASAKARPRRSSAVHHKATLKEGRTDLRIELDHLPIPPRQYSLWFAAFEQGSKAELTAWQPIGPMIVSGALRLGVVPRAIVRLSPVFVAARWSKV